MAKAPTAAALPDWWQREKQRRQVLFLLFLVLLLTLIAYFYYISIQGRTGRIAGIDFDSANTIAFVHQEKGGTISLYAVRDDGTAPHRLTTADDVSSKQNPAWTIDGKALLYASDKNDNHVRQIYILGSGQPTQLTYGTGNKDAPIASPDGKSIAFVTQGAVKTVLLNGNAVEQIIPPPRAGNAGESETGLPGEIELHGAYQTPQFSFDGRGIAAVQALSTEDNPSEYLRLGEQVSRVLPPEGNRAEQLDFGREVSLAWEPNGNRAASTFTELQLPDTTTPDKLLSGIRIWHFDTPNKKPQSVQVLLAVGYTIEPKNIAWSPDGKTLAFELWQLKGKGDRELAGIVSLPADASVQVVKPEAIPGMKMLVAAGPQGRPQNPRWSPDGSRLLYELMRPDGGHDLCLVHSDGTGQLNLTASLGGDNTQGAWSPLHK